MSVTAPTRPAVMTTQNRNDVAASDPCNGSELHPHGEQFASVTELAQREAQLTQLFGPPPPPEVRARRRRESQSTRLADVCGPCGIHLAPGDAVYVGRVGRPSLFGWSWRRVVTCEACARGGPYERGACAHCHRPVHRVRGAGSRFCCKRCQWLAASATRTARGAAGRAKACTICGRTFTAPRLDARTCSPACRQRAYRLRHPPRRRQHGALNR